MSKLFNTTTFGRPNKNLFDLSHEKKLSMNMGELIPVLCEEVLPGDTWQVNTETFMRLAPMVAPIMHRVNVYTHYFFVPNRLIWDDWEDFITGGEDGQSAPVMPYRNVYNPAAGDLMDYLGIGKAELTGNSKVSMLPIRAYQKIYNEYYRDQNLENEVTIDYTSGDDPTTDINIQTRAWEKDYFTSSLPWTQRGGDVHLPLSGNAPVNLKDSELGVTSQNWKQDDETAASGSGSFTLGKMQDGLEEVWLDPNGTLEADLSLATSANIEELRRASRLQEWLEKNARGGSRYIEQILSHFGVISSDARLQRPEYLGGGKSPVVISEVLQTSETATSPQGNMAGHGITVGNTHKCKKYFEEHGYIIGIVSVLPKTCYYQGIRRHFLKDDKFDYYWPEFAQLGEQPVYKAELYATGENEKDTFGYQSRYAEYKYIPSSVHGEMKSTQEFWHMARKFDTAPALNSSFVKSDPTHRIFADTVETNSKLYAQIYHNIRAVRPIPKFNNPTL